MGYLKLITGIALGANVSWRYAPRLTLKGTSEQSTVGYRCVAIKTLTMYNHGDIPWNMSASRHEEAVLFWPSNTSVQLVCRLPCPLSPSCGAPDQAPGPESRLGSGVATLGSATALCGLFVQNVPHVYSWQTILENPLGSKRCSFDSRVNKW